MSAAKPIRIGRYDVVRELGAGGMGVVWLARDLALERDSAIKVLHHVAAGATARLLREARALAKLSHPNVVQVFDVGTHEGRVYLAMEFVPGRTLHEVLGDGPRPWAEVRDLFLQASRGLEAAHEVGLVHRDFKPANVLVGDDGRVRVLDFGLARGVDAPDATPPGEGAQPAHDKDASSQSVTQTGVRLGTPKYMAPEQHLGAHLDGRTDQFAFCVVLYQALFGAHPFGSVSALVLATRVVRGELEPPPADADVPGWLFDIVVQGLATAPQGRHSSMQALRQRLERGPIHHLRRPAVLAAAGAIAATVAVVAWPTARSPVVRSAGFEQRPEPAPTNAEKRLRADLETVEDQYARGDHEMGLRAAESLVVEAEDLGELHLLARALRVVAIGEATLERGDRGVAALERAHSLSVEVGDQDLATDLAMRLMAELGVAQHQYVKAERWRGAAMSAARAETLDDDMPPALRREIGNLLRVQGQLEESRPLLERALADATTLHGLEHPEVARSRAALADLLIDVGEFEAAAGQLELASKVLVAHHGRRDRSLQTVAESLGIARSLAGSLDEADEAFSWALEIAEATDGTESEAYASALSNVATLAYNRSQFDRAREMFEQAVAIESKIGIRDRVGHAQTRLNLGIILRSQQQYEQGLRHTVAARTILEAELGPEHPDLMVVFLELGNNYADQGDFDRARPLYEKSVEMAADTGMRPFAVRALGRVALGQGKLDEALLLLEEAAAVPEGTAAMAGYFPETWWLLAQALWESKRDRKRAVALALKARDGYRELDDDLRNLEDIEAWLSDKR